MVTPAQLCKEYVQNLNNLGHSNVEFVYYPDAYHSFEKGEDDTPGVRSVILIDYQLTVVADMDE